MAQPPAGQQLSGRDATFFRQVVKHFESKQYKKGLKQADQILKKNPNHADTQAMKALIIHSQGQTPEAFELAKVALKNNMKSHVTWHVYGLLWRGEKNFEEATKAYKFALRLEPDSQPIQRDLAHLQIQMRDFEGYTESRRTMLKQKPGIRQNWTALAIAHHLNEDYDSAENVLTMYEETLKAKVTRADIEHWEAVLYKNMIIAESGQLEKALEHLDAVGKKCPDVQGVLEMRADYLLRLDKKEEATQAYTILLDRNSENSAYLDAYLKAKGCTEAAEIKKACDELTTKYPRSDLPKRRPLDVLSGDAFTQAANMYLLQMLRKGVPSTFANIKQLYGDKSKLETIQSLVTSYLDTAAPSLPNGRDPTEKEQENFKWSVPYFLAQHYNYAPSRNLAKALEFADKCISIDSKSVDFHAVKARTYKYMGATRKASDFLTQAANLDTKDRAINTKASKYLLRYDKNEEALDMAGKFTQNKTGTPLADLLDMQCVWFLTEDGLSYSRQHKFGLALKRFHQISAIFAQWEDDQFDFHNFSLRKGMIRAYVEMLRWEDRLRDHPFFSTMAVAAIKCYITLHTHPDLVHGPLLVNGMNGSAHGKMSDADRKKAVKKAKKEQEKQEKAEADKKALAKASKPVPKKDDDEIKKEDADPLGRTLVETKTPLEDSLQFLQPLEQFCGSRPETWKMSYEVNYLRKKYLLCAKALIRLSELNAEDADLHFYAMQLRKAVETKGLMDDRVAELIKSTTMRVLRTDESMKSLNEAFHVGREMDMNAVLAYCKVNQLIDQKTQPDSERRLLKVAQEGQSELGNLTAGLDLLKEWDGVSVLKDYVAAAKRSWPEADVFSESSKSQAIR